MRFRTLFTLISACVLAAGAQAQLTANARLVAGAAPAVIPRDYNITATSLTGNIAVGAPVHFAYGVEVPIGNSAAVAISAQTPPSFVPVLTRCVKFPNGSITGTALPCNLPTITPGALSQADDQIIVTIDGYFKQAGPVTLPFNVTRGSESVSTPVSVNVIIDILPADIHVTKLVKPQSGGTFGPAATIAFGSSVTYKIIVRNASAIAADHHTDLYLGPLLKLRDFLSTPATNDVSLSVVASSFVCTPIGGAACPTVPGSSITTSIGHPVAQSFLTTIAYPALSTGFLPAGDSFEITFDAKISTAALCSPLQNNTLGNTADITYSNNSNTISDTDPTNNSSSTTVTLTGLPTTGCSGGGTGTPTLTMTKSLLTTTPMWGGPMVYRIKFTNMSGQTLTGLTLTDVVTNSSVPPFTATFAATSVVCTPSTACTNTTPATNAPWVTGSSTLFNIALAPLANNDTVIVDYKVRYDTPCSPTGTGGVITNHAQLSGPASGNTSVTTTMPVLPSCNISVTKTNSGPATFSSFPVTLAYNVVFKNNSPVQSVLVGTLADAMAYESAAFASHIDATYSYSCTSTNVTMPTGWVPSTTNATATIQFNTPVSAGVRIFDFSNSSGALFAPLGQLACTVSVTLQQPPTDDSKCQGIAPENIVNTAEMDQFPFRYSNAQFHAAVATPLPKCVSILVGKTASDATPGSTVTFTLTVQNTGNDPATGVVLTDSVPSTFSNVTWICASGCATVSGSGNGISIPLQMIAPGATITVIVTATAPTALGSYCNTDKAAFTPFPTDTFFEGDQAALTTATACVQVKNPTATGKPKLTKNYKPTSIGQNGSTTLTFMITNSAGDPLQNGISFTDTLPAGLQFASVVNNGCGGTVTISTDHQKLSYTGGHLAAGQHICTIAVTIKASDACGVYPNDKSNFSGVENLDVSGASANLEVKGCQAGGLIVSKKVDGAPAGFTGQFTFLVQCPTSTGLYQRVVTVNYPTPGFVTLTDVPPGSQCTVTEGQMPAPPPGYNWNGLPVYSPEGGVVTTTDHGGQVTAINTLKPCVETGQVRIKKVLKGVPNDFTGTFTGTLQCWVGGHLSTFPVTLTAPDGLVVTIADIPLGSTCTFAETSQSPLPAGMQWNPPDYSPAFGNVSLTGLCCQDVIVTNEARACCEKAQETHGTPKP